MKTTEKNKEEVDTTKNRGAIEAIVAAAEEVEVAVDDTETLGTLVTAAEGEVEDGQLLIDGIMVEESLGLGRGEDMPMIVGVVVLGGVKDMTTAEEAAIVGATPVAAMGAGLKTG